MKVIKWIAIGLVALLVIVFVGAQVIVNRPFVREKITTAATEALNREVSLAGMSLSFFPSIAINLNEFKIKEKDGSTDFVSLNKLRVKAELFPLLKKKVVIKEIILEKPVIRIKQQADGQYNFQDIGAPASAPASEEVQEAKSTGTLPDVSIDAVRINHAQFSFESVNASGQTQTFPIHDLNLSVDNFSFDQPVTITLDMKIWEDVQFELQGGVGPLSAALSGAIDQVELDSQLSLTGLSMQDLLAIVPKETAEGIWFEDLMIKGSLRGSLGKGFESLLAIKTAPVGKKNTFAIDVGLTLKASPNLVNPLASVVNARLEVKEMTLNAPPFTNGLNAKGALQINTPAEINLEGFSVHIGDSDITLEGNLKNLIAPQIDFKVTSNHININDFMMEGGEKKDEATSQVASGPENPLADNAFFQQVQGKFNADLKKISYGDNVVNDVVVAMTLQNAVAEMQELSLKVFEGDVTGQAMVDLSKEKISFSEDLSINALQLASITEANLGETKATGDVNGQFSAEGSGLTDSDIKQNFKMNGQFTVSDGKLLGRSVKKDLLLKLEKVPLLSQKFRGLAQKIEEVKQEPDETPFQDLVLQVKAQMGVATLEQLSLGNQDFTLTGNGTVGFDLMSNLNVQAVLSPELSHFLFNGQELDMSQFSEGTAPQAGMPTGVPQENGGLLIPVLITGNLLDPNIDPNYEKLLSAFAKGQLTEKIGGLLGGKKDKEGKKSSNPLSGILGGGSDDKGEKKSPFGGLF